VHVPVSRPHGGSFGPASGLARKADPSDDGGFTAGGLTETGGIDRAGDDAAVPAPVCRPARRIIRHGRRVDAKGWTVRRR
jgi:hypothetical protein